MHSKNKTAEKLLGKRPSGTLLFDAFEQGYVCPICNYGAEAEWEDGEYSISEERAVTFSEYNGFVWCPNCNIDIPSCLAKLHPDFGKRFKNRRERVKEQTKIFLDSIKDSIRDSTGRSEK